MISPTSPTLHRRPLWLALGWGLVAALVWVSLTPRPPEVDVWHADKLGHFLAYLTVGGWFVSLYRGTGRLFHIGFLLGLGLLLEYLQGLSQVRSCELADIGANAAGVLAAWALQGLPAAYVIHVVDAVLDRLSPRL
jgi:VanZ family protein